VEKAECLVPLLDADHPTLVFTEYRATAKWLIQYLKTKGFRVFEADPDMLAGSTALQEELLRLDPSADSPRNSEPPNYDIYVLTDKYSEGKNFHKCRCIVNYDLPWNPIRKTQRQGRIVRVGSLHERVKIYSLSYTHTDLARYANPEEVLREKLRKIAAVFGKGSNKDLLNEGNKFISYFVRYNEAALGGNSKSKIDTLGILSSENEATYFYTIWDKIKESGHIEQVKEVLKTWQSIKRSRDSTFIINDRSRSIYSAFGSSETNKSLLWFEIVNAEVKKLRLDEDFLLNVEEWRIAEKVYENSHHEVLVYSPDKNVARLVKQINLILIDSRLPKNTHSRIMKSLNKLSRHRPLEFFNSVKLRLIACKGDKLKTLIEIEKIGLEIENSQTSFDNEWVVVCTEQFLLSKEDKKSA
jgi:hypothetical protein